MTILDSLQNRLGQSIFGQEKAVEEMLITIIAGGHALLLGMPGLAKTKMVSTLAHALDLDVGRIQGTPDLMPSDILGCEVLDEDANGKRDFRFIKGAVFSGCLIVDEINRAPPRTQSALLQAMQEGFVTIAGKNYALPRPFHVLATQNPIEHSGTYPLPQAQVDRFLMQINLDYPSRAAEEQMLIAMLDEDVDASQSKAFSRELLEKSQEAARKIPVGRSVITGVLDLIRSLRPQSHNASDEVRENVLWGPSPRAAKGLLSALRARAIVQGRASPSIEDAISLAVPVLAHRIATNGEISSSKIIEAACKTL